MTLLLRLTVFLAFIFSGLALAQNFQYRIDGSFTTRATVNPTSPETVNYTIRWNENSETIDGFYQDNYFSKINMIVVTGTKNSSGRGFNIVLPQIVNGVKSITIDSPELKELDGSIQMNITLKDSLDTSTDFTTVYSNLTQTNNASPINKDCTVGFGFLAGFCGFYQGTISEVSDPLSRCDLNSLGEMRLELATDTHINLHLRYTGSVVASAPVHKLGAFSFYPQAGNIQTSSKVCTAPLEGTTFSSENCKTQTLTGVFTSQLGIKRFLGNYTILDDKNGESCSYVITVSQGFSY